jgi:hypothetical protein
MILISHRGNLDGVNPDRENSPTYIKEAISSGFDVEIDVHWYDNGIWLGHDEHGTFWEVPISFLEEIKDRVWIHCKNFEALTNLIDKDLRIFFHEKERYTIISNGLVWAHDLTETNEKCIIPLLSEEDIESWNYSPVFGICSDYVKKLTSKGILE